VNSVAVVFSVSVQANLHGHVSGLVVGKNRVVKPPLTVQNSRKRRQYVIVDQANDPLPVTYGERGLQDSLQSYQKIA
jgi:hypothetical protein